MVERLGREVWLSQLLIHTDPVSRLFQYYNGKLMVTVECGLVLNE